MAQDTRTAVFVQIYHREGRNTQLKKSVQFLTGKSKMGACPEREDGWAAPLLAHKKSLPCAGGQSHDPGT